MADRRDGAGRVQIDGLVHPNRAISCAVLVDGKVVHTTKECKGAYPAIEAVNLAKLWIAKNNVEDSHR